MAESLLLQLRSEQIEIFSNESFPAQRKLLLLIDDWRPYEAAQAAGIEVINSLAYLAGLRRETDHARAGAACLG
jgi:hypothetical protein